MLEEKGFTFNISTFGFQLFCVLNRFNCDTNMTRNQGTKHFIFWILKLVQVIIYNGINDAFLLQSILTRSKMLMKLSYWQN